jgi:hypothetical protein
MEEGGGARRREKEEEEEGEKVDAMARVKTRRRRWSGGRGEREGGRSRPPTGAMLTS